MAWPRRPEVGLLVFGASPGAAHPRRGAPGIRRGRTVMSALAPILQAFFTDRLIRQRRAGPNTIAAYRDTWRLLLQFASRTTGTAPNGLDLAQLDTELVTAFLTHLETHRANTIATRNARLAAIRSLFR